MISNQLGLEDGKNGKSLRLSSLSDFIEMRSQAVLCNRKESKIYG